MKRSSIPLPTWRLCVLLVLLQTLALFTAHAAEPASTEPASTETLAPRPFDQATEAPETLSPEALEEASMLHRSFTWADIKLYRQRILNKWWVSIIVLPVACICMVAIANVQRSVDRTSNHNLQDFVEYMTRNIAAATVVGGALALVTYMRPDETVEVDLEKRSVRWALLIAWSYHTIFIFTLVYSTLLSVLYFFMSRTLQRWFTWESRLSRDPDHAAESSVYTDINMMILVRNLFYLQLRLIFPNADFKHQYSIQVTRYLRQKEREMVEELASFSKWSDWIVMAAFVIVNGMRMASISQSAAAVTDKMMLDDGLTFALALGILPFVLFFFIYRRLVAGLWRFLRASVTATKRKLERRERQRALRIGRAQMDGRRLTHAEQTQVGLEGDGTALFMDVSVIPSLPRPSEFVPFGSTQTVSALWRAVIVVNALYIAVLVTGLAHMLLTRLAGGPALLVVCLLPTLALMKVLPWSTAAVVVVRYLGNNIDVREALLSFADPEAERIREKEHRDAHRGPVHRFDEGDAQDATRAEDALDGLDLDATVLDQTLLSLHSSMQPQLTADKGGTGAAVPSNGPGSPASASTSQRQHKPQSAASTTSLTANAPVAGVPLAMAESISLVYQRNMHHVNERILELKRHEGALHGAVVRASYRRRKAQDQLEAFVDAVGRRPDLAPRWRQAVARAKQRADELRRGSAIEYERKIAALEARQRATMAQLDYDESKAFSFHDVFEQELAAVEAAMDERAGFLGGHIPSLANVFDAIGPTAEEAKRQLPWRHIPQLAEGDDASRRWMGESLDTTIAEQRRLRKRALRAAKRTKPLDFEELERLAAQGISQETLAAWDKQLLSSDDEAGDKAADAAFDTLSLAGGRAPPSEAATEMEVVLDNDFSLWGLTEAELEALQRPPSSPPNYDLELAEYRAKKEAASRNPQLKATRRASSHGRAAEGGDDGPSSNAATPAPARAGGGLMVTSLSKPVPGEGKKAAAADPFESSLWSDTTTARRR
jgi:hypothetical protein